MRGEERAGDGVGTTRGAEFGSTLKRKIILLVAGCVLISSAMVGTVAYHRVRTGAIAQAERTFTAEARLMSQRLRSAYHDIARDLQILAEMPPVQGIIRSSRNDGIDRLDGSSQKMWRARLETIFKSVLAQRPDSFQVRYIGLGDAGREIVRVERDLAGPRAVAESDLQRKGAEPYFALGAEAAPGQVVFSEVTYNREHAKKDPRNIPTIRGILPITDATGTRFGMLVINVDYDTMLRNAFAQMQPRMPTIIVNGKGDYMRHPGGADGRPQPLEMHDNYTHAPPPVIGKAMAIARTRDEAILDTGDTVSFAINNDKGYGNFNDRVSVIIQVPKTTLYAPAKRIGMEVLTAGAIMVVVFLLAAVFFARALMRPVSQTAIAIVENVNDGLILVDANDRIERFNPGCETIFGYSAEQVLGKPASTLLKQEDEGAPPATLARVARHAEGDTVEAEGRTREGRTVPIEMSVSEIKLNGRVKFTALIRDISERREIERVKTEFVSTVSHELRTPLTSIRGSLGLVGKMMPPGLPASFYHMISLAQKNTDRLISLVNDILDFEKLTSSKVTYEFETTEVGAELDQAVQLNAGYGDEFGVTISLERPQTEIFVTVDRGRFQQVLANLLSNAIKFSPSPGTVILKGRADSDGVRITVTDRGPGIPRDFRAQIFSPFKQGDSTTTRKIGGTGLGLSISRKLVEDMGGAIGFETEEGAGTTFWLTLPRVAAPAAGRPIARAADDPRPLGLHVEDDKDFADVLAETFKDMIVLHNARDTQSARAYMANNRFDLLIVDVALKDGNGLDLLDDIPAGSQAAVVVVTAIDEHYDDPRIDLTIVKSRAEAGEVQDRIMKLLRERRGALHAASHA